MENVDIHGNGSGDPLDAAAADAVVAEMRAKGILDSYRNVPASMEIPIKYCAQCRDVPCLACAIGYRHTNIERTLAPGDNFLDHNAKGHHHEIWNGKRIEIVACGSQRCYELARREMMERIAPTSGIIADGALEITSQPIAAEKIMDGPLAYENIAERIDKDQFITPKIAMMIVSDVLALLKDPGRIGFVHESISHLETLLRELQKLDERAQSFLAERKIAAVVINPLVVDGTVKGANSRQVGGSHYGGGAMQHWDLAVMYGWDFFQAQIIKYVMRHWGKNGVQDLEKAAHNLEKYIEEIKAGRMKQLVAKEPIEPDSPARIG